MRWGGAAASGWRGVGNILQAALMAVLKTLLLRPSRDAVYQQRLCSHTYRRAQAKLINRVAPTPFL